MISETLAREFADLRIPGGYRAILADPPWQFDSLWGGRPNRTEAGYPSRAVDAHYDTMTIADIAAMPVADLAADDCVLFMWIVWPRLPEAIDILPAWGFTYKTCGFAWFKGNALPLFPDDARDQMGMGYWTRANSEVCLLATRGKPKRKHADVRQAILEPRREHSRKPDCVYERIERLVDGPYLELFARSERPGWTSWGNQVGKFGEVA